MGRRKKKQKRSIQNPARPLSAANIVEYLGGGAKSRSGMVVNWQTALTVAPVWQAVDLITSDVSRIPFLVYRTLANGGKEPATTHPVYKLLAKHTGEMTSNLWVSRMLAHALLYGNAYSRIYWDGPRVDRIEWLHRDSVEVEYEAGRKIYLVQYTFDLHGRDGMDRVSEDDMFHLVGLSMDAYGGLSLVDYARHAIGRDMAAEGWTDDFMKNNATPSGLFEHPGEMSEAAQKRFLEAFQRRHSGSGSRYYPAILEEGMQWKSMGVTPQDALLIDQLKFSVKDISRFFNIPAYKLGDSDKIAYNTLEEENRSYFDSSLGKWVNRFECEASYKLFHQDSESAFFAQFNIDLWDKVSTDTRYKVHAIALQNGIKTQNEVRIEENLLPIDGGDELAPLPQKAPNNNPPSGTRPEDLQSFDGTDVQDEPEDDERSITIADVAKRDLLSDRLAEAMRLIGNSAKRAAKKPTKFLGYINDLQNRYSAQVLGKIEAAAKAAGESPDMLADELFERCSDALLSASECTQEQLVDRVGGVVNSWPEMARNWSTELVLERERDERLCSA